MASRVSIGSSFREVSENPRHGVPISNGEKTNDLPGKAPQGLPRELPESPGSVFSITVLEWVFSNQAARDGFREAPTRGNSGLRTKFVVFFSVALGTPKHGVPECLTTVIHLLRVCSSKFVFRTFEWFRFVLNPSGICFRKSRIAGERSAEFSVCRQLYTRISGDTTFGAEVPITLAGGCMLHSRAILARKKCETRTKDFPQSAHGWRTTSQHACRQRGQSLLARTQCMRPPSKVHKINRPRRSGGFALSLGG